MNRRKPDGPVRVLVVDDSPLMLDLMTDILTSQPGIAIAGKASNGLEAVSMAAGLKPDLITMDIEMPVMNGLDAIERIMAENPAPILVVTALEGVRTAFAAVSRGALDVVEKPDIGIGGGNDLIKKVKMLAAVDIRSHVALGNRAKAAGNGQPAMERTARSKKKIVAIASSTGGPQALQAILSRLPARFPAPVVIAQHIADGFTRGMTDWLGKTCPLHVRVARNAERLEPGTVHINPSEYSMRITGQGNIILGERAEGVIYHPPCDVLLRSVADAYGEQAAGIILSGMGDDGVDGMRAIRAAGGVTLAQDEESSVVYGMNRLAVERGYVERVLALAEIPAELERLV